MKTPPGILGLSSLYVFVKGKRSLISSEIITVDSADNILFLLHKKAETLKSSLPHQHVTLLHTTRDPEAG